VCQKATISSIVLLFVYAIVKIAPQLLHQDAPDPRLIRGGVPGVWVQRKDIENAIQFVLDEIGPSLLRPPTLGFFELRLSP
jgi:hypothetical protein